ncbi:MAG TPA: ABC transporter permease [Opitutaceae bacterium]|nr:ABC transporter permease [Opitutaceae bacterium]
MSAPAHPGFFAHLNPAALLRDLFRHRELLRQFTFRNFHTRHKGSYLGIVWAMLNPLLLLGLYFTVFGLFFKVKFSERPDETRVDVALALLLGLTVFHFLSEVIAQAPAVIVGQANLVKKVVFPLEVLPAANLGASFCNFIISLGLVILGQIVFGRGLPMTALWLPVIVLPVLLLAAGLGWLLSAIGVFFRDLAQVTQFASMLLMYASAVFYPRSSILPEIWTVLRFNPVIHAIELLRNVMLWGHPMNFTHLGWLYAAGIATCLVGYACFMSLRSSFSDVL